MNTYFAMAVLSLGFGIASVSAQINSTLVAPGSQWRFLDTGVDQLTAWRDLNFDDSSWRSGPAQLGYGDGDEQTIVSFGTNSEDKFRTTYFRHAFTVTDPSCFTNLFVHLLRDDGGVVYLNGVEVFRSNMPLPPFIITFGTFASGTIPNADESVFFTTTASPTLLRSGLNVVAVEIHQGSPDSSDLSFDFELIAQAGQGPASITAQPRDINVLAGQSAVLSATAGGECPLIYQWSKDGTDISGATNSTLLLGPVTTNDVGLYRVAVTNAQGTDSSVQARLAVSESTDNTFQIVSLSSNIAFSVQNSVVDDDRAGVAVSGSHVFVNADAGTAKLTLDGLSDATNVGRIYDALLSNLRTETVYVLANGSTPVSGSGSVASHLLEIDSATGQTGNQITLSSSITLNAPGLFSGLNRVVILSGTRLFDVALPSGTVTDLGTMSIPPHLVGEGWGAWWGVAEFFDGAIHLVYQRDPTTIVRTTTPSGPTEVVTSFPIARDISGFTVSLSRNRWYFHQEEALVERTGYADAAISFVSLPRPPTIVTHPQSQFVGVGATFTLSVSALGSQPLSYQWYFNDEPITDATNATLQVGPATVADSGIYFVVVNNAAGFAASDFATISVGTLSREMFDDFDPGIDFSQWSQISSNVLATNYGGSVSAPNSLWFGSDTVREAVSRPLDTTAGGLITFSLRLADGGGNPWEQADFLPQEGVVLEYSVTGGSNWTEIAAMDTQQYYSWTLTAVPIPPGAQSLSTLLRWRQRSHSGPGFDHWALDNVRVRPVTGPPEIFSHPQSQTILVNGTATFSAVVAGEPPLQYQWLYNGGPLSGATNVTLVLSNVTLQQAGNYAVTITNPRGSVTSSNAVLQVLEITGEEFQILELLATGSRVAEHNELTGDDRGGIAVSSNRVFYSGDEATARFNLSDLSGGTRVGRIYDSLVSNLRTETVYTLANGATPVTSGGGIVNRLIELDGNTGALTTRFINLSTPIPLPSFSVGIFSGFDRILLYATGTVYHVSLPSGQVVRLQGPQQNQLGASTCENWAFWGVAEFFGGSLYMSYVGFGPTGPRVARARIPDGQISTISSFNSLSDMCSFTVSLSLDRWYFHHEGGSQFGGQFETIGFADAALRSSLPPKPVEILTQPLNQSVLEGTPATFSVTTRGTRPITYQWRFNGADLTGETNSALVISNVTSAVVGNYSVVVSNASGALTSVVATLSIDSVTSETFYVRGLFNTGSRIIDHEQLTGDRRGAIAAGATQLFYSGDSATARFSIEDLSAGTRVGRVFETLVSNLRTETVYTLATGFLPLGRGGNFSALIEINPATGATTTNRVVLSSTIVIPAGGVGLFSGWDKILVHTGTRVFQVSLPSGQVRDLGAMPALTRQDCDWSFWGIAEFFGGSVHLLYVRDPQTIVRTRVPDGATSVVGSFSYLSSMCSFTVSPYRNRWYFQHEFGSEFGGANETLGFADAAFIHAPIPPRITSQPRSRSTLLGASASFTVRAAGGGASLSYQWLFNDMELPGETNATLLLQNVTSAHAGNYHVIVSNVLGTATSQVATLSVRMLQGSDFRITRLSTNGCPTVEHIFVTGNDRGGIALSGSHVFYSGDSSTARFPADDLSGGTSLGRIEDALVSNLRTEQLYSLGNGTTKIGSSGGEVTTLIELDGATALPTGGTIQLSRPIRMQPGSGIFAGLDQVVLTALGQAYSIELPSGAVTDLGPVPVEYAPQGCENWAHWGIAESFDGSVHLVYVRDFQSIVRTRLPDGATTNVATFQSLGDMCSITFSLSRNRWYFHHQGFSSLGSGNEVLGFCDAIWDQPPPTPAEILEQPASQLVLEGTTAAFSVAARGARPLTYQWQFNGVSIPGANGPSLLVNNVTSAAAGNYTVVVSNALNVVTSAVATLSIELVTAETFYISGLFGSGVRLVEHEPISGDRRGAIAAGTSQLFYSGDDATARFSMEDLSGGTRIGRIFETLVSNLRTETVYTLATGFLPLGRGGNLTSLLQIDRATGALTTNRVVLSSTIVVPGTGVGIFSGWDRVVIHTGARAYSISLLSGQVTDLGPMAMPPHQECDWSYWGVAEYFGGAIHLVTLTPSAEFVRTRVPDGETSSLAQFIYLSDMCSFTVSSYRNRWYFQHQGASEFGGFNETLGFADATFIHEPIPPRITTQPRSHVALEGRDTSFQVQVAAGSGPLSYQWRFNNVDLPGATSQVLLLQSVTPAHAGDYTVVVSNALGVATSQVATLTLRFSEGFTFRLSGLTTNGCMTVEHDALTGDDHGGIGASSSHLFYTGDGSTARFSLADLSGGTALGRVEDTLVSNLRTEKLYALGFGTNVPLPNPRADYQLQNSLDTSIGAAPTLFNLGANTFGAATVDGESWTVLRFAENDGVMVPFASSVISSNAYTAVLLFSFETVSSWRRIIDFKAATSDFGLYNFNGQLQFYPWVTGPTNAIPTNTFVQVALTRDGSSNVVGYVNGVQQFSFIDTNSDATLSAQDALRFFRDNGSEGSAGSVARIRLYDVALTPQQVAALDRLPAPTGPGTGEVAALFELDPVTAQPNGNLVQLSQPIRLFSPGGIFAGYDRVVLSSAERFYNIDLPSGQVTELGVFSFPYLGCETWAHWGIAEYFDGAVHVVYVRDPQTIARTRLTDGFTSTVATFDSLSDMCSITLSLARNRWYFHHEGSSQFGFGNEMVGFCGASWDMPNLAPTISAAAEHTILEDGNLQNFLVTLADAETSPSLLTLTAESSNQALVRNDSIIVGGIGNSRTLSLVPVSNATGTVTITLIARDVPGASTTGTVNIIVQPVNDVPAFTKGQDVAVLEDAPLQTIPAWATGISAGPANESGQLLTFIVDADNPALFEVLPVIAADGTLTFKPAPNANGSALVRVRLRDNGGTANGGIDTSAPQTFTIIVAAVNDAPVFTKGADNVVVEDAPLQTVPNWATGIAAGPPDEAGQSLSFIVSTDNPGLFEVLPVIAPNGTLTFKPTPNANGQANVQVVLQDSGGRADGGADTSAPQTFRITVLPVNDAPSFIGGPNVDVMEDAPLQTVANWAMGMSPGPPDESGQTLAFIVTTGSPALFDVLPAITPNGTLTFKPAANAHGSASVQVVLRDNGGTANGGVDTSAAQAFRITIGAVNDPPAAQDQNIAVNEDGAVIFTLSATDPDGDSLTYTHTQPAHGVLSGTAPALSYAPNPDYFGPDSFTFTVSDGAQTATATISITVNAVNDAPTAAIDVSSPSLLDANPPNYVAIAQGNTNAIIILDASRSSDPENDPLQYAWFVQGSTTPFAEGVLTTNRFAPGTYTVVLAVSDGTDSASASVVIEVILPGEAINALILLIEESGISAQGQRPLLATLAAANAAFDRNDFIPAYNQLRAFQNKIKAQIAPSDPALAAELIEIAQSILYSIGEQKRIK